MAQNADLVADPRLVACWRRPERLSASPSRVAAQAEPDQVLATEAVPELLVGVTGTPPCEPAGERRLKGVPGTWRLHRAVL